MLADALLCSASGDALTPATELDTHASPRSGAPFAYVRHGRISYDYPHEWLETRRLRRSCAALERQLRRGSQHAPMHDE